METDLKYLNRDSLFQTIDNVSEALLYGLEIEAGEKDEIAEFIVNQHLKPWTYAGTFAPTYDDLKHDLILFTGERIRSRVGMCHIAGEEACRILRKLDLPSDRVKTAIKHADLGLEYRIIETNKNSRYHYGMYCCKPCSCGLWLNLSSGGLHNNTDLLLAGLGYLKHFRDDTGKWTGFPYFYILYILNEIEKDLAMDEMIYASPLIESRLKRKRTDGNKYDQRRDYISKQILDKVNNG